jgi:hypothetical protein
LNSNPGHFNYFTFIFVSFRESRSLVSWCVGGTCDMTSSDDGYDRSRRPDTDDWGWSDTGWILSGRTIGRLGDAVCSLHHAHEDDEHVFLG